MKPVFYFISIPLLFFTACSSPGAPPGDTASTPEPAEFPVYKIINDNQVLLTNSADFKGHTSLYGASAFLVEHKNKTYAVTAKHLIGEQGEVRPEIQPAELGSSILNWKMFPRVPLNEPRDTVIIGKEQMNYDELSTDILMLPVENNQFDILRLKANFNLPERGDDLFIIGCPYSEGDCKQNIYDVVFESYNPGTAALIVTSSKKIEINGFSGAPLLDIQGNVVGVIVGMLEEKGRFFIYATSIKEIEKIK
jgi:hypothetical protein